MKQEITKYALLHALGSAIYINAIALVISNGEALFGKTNHIMGTIAFLLTFVISAAVMGLLIFARPVMWYLNGSKKEAVSLAIATVGFLIIIAVLVFLAPIWKML